MRIFHRRHSRGRPPHPDVLTPAEWRVLEQLRERTSNAAIAEQLHVSVNTVKTHISSMLAKLDLADREALAGWNGEPAEASRRALRRVPALLAPLVWVQRRAVALATPAKIVAISAGTVAFAGAFWIAFDAAQGDAGGERFTQTPTPAASPAETTVAAEPTADAVAVAAAAGTTGIAEVALVIGIVEAHDPVVLRAMLEFRALPCTNELGDGGPPPCPGFPDAPLEEGTEVVVFEFWRCSVDWHTEATIDAALTEIVATAATRYAAFEPPTDYLLDAPYIIVFEGLDLRVNEPSPRGLAVAVDDGRIVAVWLACGAGAGADSMIPDGLTDFLLAPPS